MLGDKLRASARCTRHHTPEAAHWRALAMTETARAG
jgi:hypothetical protein